MQVLTEILAVALAVWGVLACMWLATGIIIWLIDEIHGGNGKLGR